MRDQDRLPDAQGQATPTVAISACLLGVPCRYDAASKPCPELVDAIETLGVNVLEVCPEVAGGLPTPRVPSEIVISEQAESKPTEALSSRISIPPHSKTIVLGKNGSDNTDAYLTGARRTLDLLRKHGCTGAILKEKSPSCGSTHVYDGSFSGRLRPGEGVTTRLLRENGVTVISEEDYLEALRQGVEPEEILRGLTSEA